MNNNQYFVIFDWDDTLFPTTWLTNEGCIKFINEIPFIKLTTHVQQKLRTFETVLFNFLGKLNSCECELFIITNSKNGWVEQSCDVCFPSVKQFIDRMHIISARPAEYEKTDWLQWKEHKFELCFKKLYEFPLDLVTKHIISIGDSTLERDAAKKIGRNDGRTFVKAVKLQEAPTLEQMIDEHAFLQSCYDYILSIKKHLDVKIFYNTIEIFASNILI